MTEQYCVEVDLIGKRKIPSSAYYGLQAIRAKENFNITGNVIHSELIVAIAIVKRATAISNMESDHLNDNLGNAICKATDEIIQGKLHEQFIVGPIQGGAGTSFNMNANEVITNRVLEILSETKGNYNIVHPNTHVNMPNLLMTRFLPSFILLLLN